MNGPGEEGLQFGLYPGLNPLESVGAGEKAPIEGVIALPGVQASRYGVLPPPGAHGVIEGVCPGPISPPKLGIIIEPGRGADTSMACLHLSASSRRSKAPVPP